MGKKSRRKGDLDYSYWKDGYRAIAYHQKMAPRKIRPIADLVREKSCTYALSVLTNMPNKSALLLKNVIKSAMANAQSSDANIDEENLYVSGIMIGDGPRQKRIWRRARGKADIQLKRTSHIYVKLDENRSKGSK